MNRRDLVIGAAAVLMASAAGTCAAFAAAAAGGLREAARIRGIDIGANLPLRYLEDPQYDTVLRENFTLVANQYDEMAWKDVRGLNGFPPHLDALNVYIDKVRKLGLRLRARQVYSHEDAPLDAHLRRDGTPKSRSELETTLAEHARQVCTPLKGMNATIQVLDEVLADHEGGIRKDPFSRVLGEHMVDILFHAAHEAAPDARLTYQEFGPEVDPHHFYRRKVRDYLALLERLRKRNVPITGAAFGGWFMPTSFHGRGHDFDSGIFRAVENLDYDIHLDELTVIYQTRHGRQVWHPRSEAENERTLERMYGDVFRFFCSFRRLREITFWNPFDSWNTQQTGTLELKPYPSARPGIFDTAMKPKGVYRVIAKEIERSVRRI